MRVQNQEILLRIELVVIVISHLPSLVRTYLEELLTVSKLPVDKACISKAFQQKQVSHRFLLLSILENLQGFFELHLALVVLLLME